MEYTWLGRTGIWVSRLGLGGAPLGGDFGYTAEEDAIRTIHAALDEGITFYDTAPLYGRGESERRMGKGLKGNRDKVVLASKAVMRGDAYTYANTIKSVEESLQRLQTDWIDVMQLHEAESTTFNESMEGTIEAFLKLKEQGKIRAIGVNARRLEVLEPYIRTGLLDTVQTYCRYTLMDHSAREDLFPLTREYNIAVINGSPLHMGILADTPAGFMLNHAAIMEETEARKEQLRFLRAPGPHGLVEAAMRFSLTCPDIAVTLSGASTPDMIKHNASFCDGKGLAESDQQMVFDLFAGKPLVYH
ncbi:aldo/keto reductase [Paenibacillus periandrae]|uniref:aldo/keto reductase n=1 Tax=Paenibacillus periandrae TaxID=1761741 RepID=UPI001F09141E|nr:aldo/keto reductase [Paenibacillus periandrae]